MSDVEKLSRLRYRLLLAGTMFWALWYGPIVLGLSPWFTPGGEHVLHLVSDVFALPWIVSFLWLFLVLRRIKAQPAVCAALNDEMTVRNRGRASRFAMGVVMACLIVGVGLATFVHLSAVPALAFLIWIVVVVKIGAYLWYDRSE